MLVKSSSIALLLIESEVKTTSQNFVNFIWFSLSSQIYFPYISILFCKNCDNKFLVARAWSGQSILVLNGLLRHCRSTVVIYLCKLINAMAHFYFLIVYIHINTAWYVYENMLHVSVDPWDFTCNGVWLLF